MNYKRFLKSRNLRMKILDILSWMPDKMMVKLQYRIHVGRKLNLKNPQRFTEKLQWYKLHFRDERLWHCVDKVEVKDYLSKRGYDQWLIPTLGVYGKVEDIDFDKLPNQFVVKTTDGGGSNEVYVCRCNDAANRKIIIERFRNLGGRHRKPVGREWAYEMMPPTRIIVEKFIENDNNLDEALTDYKFYCFNGQPKYIQVIGSRSTKETIDFFDLDWNHQPFYGLNPVCGPAEVPAAKPRNLNEMVRIAKALAEDFPFVRVDLYNINGQIYFGELTFYPASGYGIFTPDEWDFKLGKMMNISKEFTLPPIM